MKKLTTLLALIGLGFMAFAAGESDGSNKKIGLLLSTLNNPFFVDLKSGAEAATNGTDYTLIVLDAQDDPAKQASQMEDLIAKKVSLILVNPVDSSSVGTSIELANQAKIPVITVDRGSDTAVVAAHVASDNMAGGKMAGDFVKTLIAASDKVIELEGIPGSSAAIDRGKGFNASLGSDYRIVKQVANFNRVEGEQVTSNLLANNADVKAIFAHNDEMALGALAALEGAGIEGVYIVGFDATDDALAAVKEGRMVATVAQKPKDIGALAVETGIKILAGESVDSFTPVELGLVTQ